MAYSALGPVLALVNRRAVIPNCIKRHTLNNGIDGARLLAKAAVNALCHVDIVTCRPPASVHTLLGLDCDSLRWTDSFAQLASNAALLASWVPSQGVLATETGGNRALLEGVEDGVSNRLSEPAFSTLCERGEYQLSTYGGLKNCSSDTYMPRNISMSKKYLPALSRAESPSSHFFWRGNRNPGGGGPAGVAARGKVVLKKATVAGEANRGANCDCLSSVVADGPRASIVNGLVLAIVGAGELRGRRWRCRAGRQM